MPPPDPDRGAALGGAERVADQGERQRHQHGPAGSLHDPRRDEQPGPGGKRGHDRAGGEDRQPEDVHAAPAEPVTQRGAGQHQAAEGQVVGVDRPFQVRRSYAEFEGRSSLRTWLYRIATNACLRALETRAGRPLPSGLGAPGEDPAGSLAAARPEIPWLQPFPDALLSAGTGDPAEITASRASVRLALIAAMQYLPARQRAVLILRDVLGWRSAEVAGLLGTSTVAVNGALQRARAHLAQAAPTEDEIGEPDDPAVQALLGRYATAFENADVAGLIRLLRDDATFEMPPLPTWFAGREPIGRFLATQVLPRPGRFRMVPAAANGQPAFAAYLRGDDGIDRAHAVQVLTVTRSGLARIVSFNDPSLFAPFGLPRAVSAVAEPPAQLVDLV